MTEKPPREFSHQTPEFRLEELRRDWDSVREKFPEQYNHFKKVEARIKVKLAARAAGAEELLEQAEDYFDRLYGQNVEYKPPVKSNSIHPGLKAYRLKKWLANFGLGLQNPDSSEKGQTYELFDDSLSALHALIKNAPTGLQLQLEKSLIENIWSLELDFHRELQLSTPQPGYELMYLRLPQLEQLERTVIENLRKIFAAAPAELKPSLREAVQRKLTAVESYFSHLISESSPSPSSSSAEAPSDERKVIELGAHDKEGKYFKIKIQLTRNRLWTKEQPYYSVAPIEPNDEAYLLKQKGGGKVSRNPQMSFIMAEGESLLIKGLEFVLENSEFVQVLTQEFYKVGSESFLEKMGQIELLMDSTPPDRKIEIYRAVVNELIMIQKEYIVRYPALKINSEVDGLEKNDLFILYLKLKNSLKQAVELAYQENNLRFNEMTNNELTRFIDAIKSTTQEMSVPNFEELD